MQIIDNIPVWGTQVDEGALKQIRTCYWIFGQAAMMADHHKGYGVPIGGVIAHEYLISPSGVGYDIGCGNKAVLTDADARHVRANIARIMDDVWSTVSFGLGRKNREDIDHELFENDDAWQIKVSAQPHYRALQRTCDPEGPGTHDRAGHGGSGATRFGCSATGSAEGPVAEDCGRAVRHGLRHLPQSVRFAAAGRRERTPLHFVSCLF
jgi:hypothetical protein